MSALRLLALSYIASASVFVVAATVATRPELARELAAGANALAGAAAERLIPFSGDDEGPVARLELAPPSRTQAPPPVKALPSREQQKVAANDDRFNSPDFSASTIIPILPPDLSPESAPVPSEPKLVEPKSIQPDVRVAAAPPVLPKQVEPKSIEPDVKVASAVPPTIPKPDRLPPVHDRATAANQRLKGTLTPEMVQNFGLIVYVSKARTGPLAQRMLVFENKSGALKPIHDWAASTGREQDEISPRGRRSFTATPKGFYELDPDRLYLRYHSWSWDQDMPHAMFFNWQRRGISTGLAIHAATGADIAKLGSRASAGCVHLAPEHARQLYRLVRDDYRGKMPRFSYNAATQTMTNSGTFMHDRKGALRMIDGYRVLVVIDDFGGDSRVADLD